MRGLEIYLAEQTKGAREVSFGSRAKGERGREGRKFWRGGESDNVEVWVVNRDDYDC